MFENKIMTIDLWEKKKKKKKPTTNLVQKWYVKDANKKGWD